MTATAKSSSAARHAAASPRTPWRSTLPLLGLLLLTLAALTAPVCADADANPDEASLILPETAGPSDFIRNVTGSNCTFLDISTADAILAATVDLEAEEAVNTTAAPVATGTGDEYFYEIEVEVDYGTPIDIEVDIIDAVSAEGGATVAPDAPLPPLSNGTVLAIIDEGEDTFGCLIQAAGVRLRCNGGMAVGFVIDGSGSVDASEMNEMKNDVADFIDQISSNSDPNPSLFYANLFGTALRDSTGPGGFRADVGDVVSDQVRTFQSDFANQASNVAAGLVDMAAQFSAITDPVYAAIAFVLMDGISSDIPSTLTAAAQDLKDATLGNLNFPVTVIGVPIGPGVPMATIEEIASAPNLVFGAPAFNFLPLPLENGILAVDTDGDSVLDCDDGCPANPTKTEPGIDGCLAPPPSVCRGTFGFVIDSSDSFGQSNFDQAVAQVASFISDNSEFTTLGVANSNEYYAVSYTTVVEDRTNLFSVNAFDGVATAVATGFPFIGGATKDTAVGLGDLREQFVLQDDSGVPSDARFAFVITDGIGDSVPLVRAAADLLKDRSEVIVVVLPPAGAFDAAVVNEIASEDQNGVDLVVPISDYTQLASAMASSLATLDSDNDGTNDCMDLCPLDALKLDGGVCGCGVPEVAGC